MLSDLSCGRSWDMHWLAGCLAVLCIARATPTPWVELEMYAAVSSTYDINQPANLDLYDAAGLMKYLLTEIVPESGKSVSRPGRINPVTGEVIDRIVKYKIQVLNPLERMNVTVQSEFSPFALFQNGAVVGDTSINEIASFGDLVGISVYRPPHSDPRFPLNRTYYWFSLSGRCPNLPDGQKDSKRKNCLKYNSSVVPGKRSKYVQGGRCKKLRPTGTPGCVYSIRKTLIKVSMLDDIVGISKQDCGNRPCGNWQDFRAHCTDKSLQFLDNGVMYCKEYDFPSCIDTCYPKAGGACDTTKEVGIPFWKGRCNSSRNLQRTDAAIASLGGDYENRYYASNPPCEQYSACSKPIPDAGIAYCHRDHVGICDACYVPGTVHPPPPDVTSQQVPCRLDLFQGKNPQYQNAYPQCNSDCTKPCSIDSDEDRCCLYIGKCTRTWQTGNWSECDAPCGNGNKTRVVTCPFEDVLGPCDKNTQPANKTACRGDRCPWDKKNFTAWSACDNGCSVGTESRSPVCDCPPPCPGGIDECAKSTKPSVQNRSCYIAQSMKPDFCAQCPSKGGSCQKCLENFTLGGDRKCINHRRVVETTYHLSANGSLLGSDVLLAAMVPALQDLFGSLANVSAQVASVTGDKGQLVVSALRRLSAEGARGLKVRVVAGCEDSDAGLNHTLQQIESADLASLTSQLPQALKDHGCTSANNCTVPKQLNVTMTSTPEPFCPQGARWKPGSPCVTPKPPSPFGPSSGGLPAWAIALIALAVVALIAVTVILYRRQSATSPA